MMKYSWKGVTTFDLSEYEWEYTQAFIRSGWVRIIPRCSSLVNKFRRYLINKKDLTYHSLENFVLNEFLHQSDKEKVGVKFWQIAQHHHADDVVS